MNADSNRRNIPLEKIIRIDSDNERTNYDEKGLDRLLKSIRRRGVRQNIMVSPANAEGEHFLVAGFRRHKATEMLLEQLCTEGTPEAHALLLERSQVPCLVLTEEEMLEGRAESEAVMGQAEGEVQGLQGRVGSERQGRHAGI